SVSALALGLQLIWGPVQCSGASRPARLRCPPPPSAGLSALALRLPPLSGPVQFSPPSRPPLPLRPVAPPPPALALSARPPRRRLALEGYGRAARRLELRDDPGARVAEGLQVRGVERVHQLAHQRERRGLRRDLRRPPADRRRDRAGVARHAGRVAEACGRVALLAVGDRLRLERDAEVIADAAEVGLRLAHQLLVLDVHE